MSRVQYLMDQLVSDVVSRKQTAFYDWFLWALGFLFLAIS